MMLTKAQVKDIQLLSEHKYRKQYGLYVVEGEKLAKEWLESSETIAGIYATELWINANKTLINRHTKTTVYRITEDELKKISGQKSPNNVLLTVKLPENTLPAEADGWYILLDRLQDPGNMGTIIRIADWYGITHIIATPDSVDFYNPKVVQSSMGGHLRVQLHTALLEEFMQASNLPVYAAVLNGTNIHHTPRSNNGAILIGNESKGISNELIALAQHKITIPRKGGAESLNAAVATGIICAAIVE